MILMYSPSNPFIRTINVFAWTNFEKMWNTHMCALNVHAVEKSFPKMVVMQPFETECVVKFPKLFLSQLDSRTQ